MTDSLEDRVELAIRAAELDWAADPRVPRAFERIIREEPGTESFDLADIRPLGAPDAEHLKGCASLKVQRVARAYATDDDGCRISNVVVDAVCDHSKMPIATFAVTFFYAEYGELTQLLKYMESTS